MSRLLRLSHGDAVGPPAPAGLQGRLRLGGRVALRQARGGQVQVAAQEGGGGGAAGCHPRGRGASLRSSAGNVGRVPPVQYVWINIVSLRRHADFANCDLAGAAGLEGVFGHWDIPRLTTLALRRDQPLSQVGGARWFLPAPHFVLSLAQE